MDWPQLDWPKLVLAKIGRAKTKMAKNGLAQIGLFHPQGSRIRSSHELHKVIIIGCEDRSGTMAKLQKPHATNQDRPRNSEQRMYQVSKH